MIPPLPHKPSMRGNKSSYTLKAQTQKLSRMDNDRLKRAQAAVESLVYLPTLRDSTENPTRENDSQKKSADKLQDGSLATYRPWDRRDLNRRLRTFKVRRFWLWYVPFSFLTAVIVLTSAWQLGEGNHILRVVILFSKKISLTCRAALGFASLTP